ncbi:MAG: stalk domain-containing protein [Caldisericia bacterium]|nr:stalk domain-containing protein [Caldisericia bacterium]
MRKILAFILITLMALSFVPFRTTKTVSAQSAKNATMIVNALWSVTFNAPPTRSTVNSDLRPYSFLWYVTGYTPFLGTDVYLTVISDAAGSKLLDRYYAIVAIDGNNGLHLFLDPDTTFETPATTNNTRRYGPFPLGSTLSDWTIVVSGRNFVLNFLDNDYYDDLNEGDGLVLFEVLQASCCGNEVVYDIAVESDMEPAYWTENLPRNPIIAARLSKGTGTDILTPISQQLSWSVAQKVATTVFHNIKLTNREFLDLEIWFDDGYDNITADDYTLISHNTSDDYVPLTQGELWFGALGGNYGDLPNQGQVIRYTDVYGNTQYFLDDGDNIVEPGEFLLEPIEDELYFKVKKQIDIVDSTVWTGTPYVPIADVNVIDIDGDTSISAGDTVVANDTFYYETPLLYTGLTLRFGDFRGFDIPVLPGKMNLDVKVYETYPDGNVVDKLRVEETYTVVVSLPDDCTLPPGARVHVLAQVPGYYPVNLGNAPNPPFVEGYETVLPGGDFYLSASQKSYRFEVTPWRGSLAKTMKHDYPQFRISAYAEICGAIGPEDGTYGNIVVPFPADAYVQNDPDDDYLFVNGVFRNMYDCWFEKYYPIEPEVIVATGDRDCISYLDQRFPNFGIYLENIDNPIDVDDPSGPFNPAEEEYLYAYVNASGGGILWYALVKDANNNLYILQKGSSVDYLWLMDDTAGPLTNVYDWSPNNEILNSTPISVSPAMTFVDSTSAPLKNGIPDPGETVGTTGTTYTIVDYPLPVGIVNSMVMVPVKPPTKECDEIKFTVFTTTNYWNILYPLENTYVQENNLDTRDSYWYDYPTFPLNLDFQLIDYMTKEPVTVKTAKIYDINFAEFEIVDEGLRNSPFGNPYPPYGPAANQFPWVLRNLTMELRSYPGGQSNLPGSGWGYNWQGQPNTGPVGASNPSVLLPNGFNSRHAQFRNVFWKLGTEYYPLTNYTIRFILKDKYGYHLTPTKVVVEGIKASPDGQPVFMVGPYNGAYTYNTTPNLPKSYKYFNYWSVTSFGSIWYPELPGGYIVDEFEYEDGWVLEDVVLLQGIIPTGPGYIKVTAYYYDAEAGKTYSVTYKYCTSCMDTPENIPVHAVELVTDKNELEVDADNTLKVTAKVYPFDKDTTPYGETTITTKQPLANNVVMFLWQDRGILDPVRPELGTRYGVGDGWISGQTPKGGTRLNVANDLTNNPPVLSPVYNGFDFTGDGKISFKDYETEIVGTYDIATRSWNGGFISYTALTTNINQGEYVFNLISAFGAQLNEIGFDFDRNGILLDNEVIPVRLTSYVYGDDGINPRVANKYTGNIDDWEVYLAGQKELKVVGKKDYNVETKPCLTAGVVPEYNGSDPLTFVVTDADGNPVDLSKGVNGVTITDYSLIQNYLFRPNDGVNNWVRVLLNSTVDDNVWNSTIFAIRDFTGIASGVYKFLGFTANDKGKFLVQVYSPDRKHYGEVEVVVELPKVKWEIVNLEDPNGTVHEVPGDPDFVMTVGDLRFYKVTVTATDCNGNPIGGPGKPADICAPEIEGVYAGFLPYVAYTPHYFNLVATSYDEAGRVYSFYEPREPEFGYGFTKFDVFGDTVVDGVPNPPDEGWWTNNAIYNNDYNYDKWNWGQLFPDLSGTPEDECPVINLDDTIPLDENGQATFFVITTDIGALSGILGKNLYNDDDINGDGAFYLDWYANADTKVDINFLRFEVLDGETHLELSKDIFNPNYYDLTYGLENHLVVHALPADERDLPARPGVQVQLVGNVEVWAYGTLDENSMATLNFRPRGTGTKVAYLAVVNHYGDDFFWMKDMTWPWWADYTSPGEPLYWTYDDRAPDFTSEYVCGYPKEYYGTVKPYGHDLADARKLTRISPPVGNASWPLPYFDSAKGLGLSLKGDLVVGVETEVVVKVTEAGPNFPVAGASVTLYGAGVDLSGVTDADGVAKFMVKPTEAGEILVSASKDGYVPGKVVVVVGADTIAPELSVDKPISPTNKPTVTITGIATDNAGVPTVMVNGVEATVGADGKFSAEVTLKEGENEIVVVAKDKSGNKTEKVVKVVLDTIPPEVTVMVPPGPITTTKVKLTGYVEAGAKVVVNDKPATVTYDDWEVELTLNYGENLVTVVATDAVGNSKKVEVKVVVFRKTTLELQIGNPTPKVNGVYGDPLEAAPFIQNGRTMVPLRFIAEAFGANVEWIPETKGINITLQLKSAVHTIGLQVGNPTAIVDGQVVTLDVAPVIVNGRTFVPLRFVAEAFGAKVDWNSLYQTVTIEFLWYN